MITNAHIDNYGLYTAKHAKNTSYARRERRFERSGMTWYRQPLNSHNVLRRVIPILIRMVQLDWESIVKSPCVVILAGFIIPNLCLGMEKCRDFSVIFISNFFLISEAIPELIDS